MMLEKFENKGIADDINSVYDMMLKKEILGSQRALQFAGPPILKHNARLYNCSSACCCYPRFFQETMYLLLCGCGVGYSVQQHHINKLPLLNPNTKKKKKKFVIPDSIEGWADSIGVLLSSFFSKTTDKNYKEYLDTDVEFDFSEIRPEGSYLSSSSGKAPGPEPLKLALRNIKDLLQDCIYNDQKKLKPINAHDIVMYLADSVLSGGVRRSACISLFSYEDKEMMECKTGDWLVDNPQRARANNSVMFVRSETSLDQFKEIIELNKENGEPGFVFTDDKDKNITINPCGEIGMYAFYNGKPGFQFCNLTEINCGTLKSEQDFYDRCRATAIIGTLQGAFTSFPYLGNITEQITKREALLGVSLTGIMQKPKITLKYQIQKKGANIVKATNKEFAQKIGINQAARTTCTKPSGTASTVLGVSAGIHPHHSKRYIRRVQVNQQENPYRFFKELNPKAVEKSKWSTNNDDVVMFPIEVPDGSKLRNQLPALDMLEIIKNTQKNWIDSGKNEELCINISNNHSVSNTITVHDDEWDSIIKYLYKNRQYFSTVSFLSYRGDKDYYQAPFTNILTSHEIISEYGD